MTNYNETIQDIIQDIRENDGLCISPTSLFGFDEDGGVLLGDLAERIKVAHEREMASKDAEIEKISEKLKLHNCWAVEECEDADAARTRAELEVDGLRSLVGELANALEKFHAWEETRALVARAREMIGGAE